MTQTFEIGDWVLVKTKQGKVWRLLEIKDTPINNYSSYYVGENIKVKNNYSKGSWLFAIDKGALAFKVPKGGSTENLSIAALTALYAKNTKEASEWRVYEPSKKYRVQLEFETPELAKEILDLLKTSDITLKSLKFKSNGYITSKYKVVK